MSSWVDLHIGQLFQSIIHLNSKLFLTLHNFIVTCVNRLSNRNRCQCLLLHRLHLFILLSTLLSTDLLGMRRLFLLTIILHQVRQVIIEVLDHHLSILELSKLTFQVNLFSIHF